MERKGWILVQQLLPHGSRKAEPKNFGIRTLKPTC